MLIYSCDFKDVDKRGVIHYTEFLAATLEVHGTIDEDKMLQVFRRFDKSSKGYLTHDDVREVLGPESLEAEINGCLKEADFDHDGKISYEDFRALFNDQLHNVIENVEKIVLRRRLSLTNLQVSGFPSTKNVSIISCKPSSSIGSDSTEYEGNDDTSVESGVLLF